MTKLTNASISRAGRTARTWNFENSQIELKFGDEGLDLRFSLSSKGGGITDVRLTIGPKDFASVASAMVSADRASATCALADTLAKEMAKQGEHDKATAQKARQSVLAAAENAFVEAPSGKDHAERLVRDMVREFVKELNSDKQGPSTPSSP